MKNLLLNFFRLTGLVLLAMTMTACSESTASSASLRFDGVYQSPKVDYYWYYHRFYEDGTVLTVSSEFPPSDVAKWLDKNNIKEKTLSHGTYTLSNGQVIFLSQAKNGVVEYKGSIDGDRINMNIHSRINGADIERPFYFVPFEKETL